MSPFVEVVEWEEPPPSKSNRKHHLLMAELKARPGEWGVVATGAVEAGSVSGFGRVFREAGFQVTSRTLPDGSAKLFARWPAPEAGAA